MSVVTLREYKNLIRRQEKIEMEIDVLKKIVRQEVAEAEIKPAVLRKWERISRDFDRGGGRSFSSLKEMQKWLKNL